MRQKLIPTILILSGILLLAISANAAKVKDFIPKETALYLKLQDIDEVYAALGRSENWKKVHTLLQDTAPEVQQGLTTALTLFGTDLPTLIGSIGYRTGIAIWKNETSELQMGFVVHSGGHIGELQRLTKILTGMIGMQANNTLQPEAGEYRKVKYGTLELPGQLISYGFVDEFLVAGIGDGSFEKLIDTFQKSTPSIAKKPEFAAGKKLDSGQVIAFANVQEILPLIRELDEIEQAQFSIFQTVFGRLNLLETGPVLEVTAQFRQNSQEDAEHPENIIGLFLKEGAPLKTLNAVSRHTDLFIAVAPAILEAAWQLVRNHLEKDATNDTHAAMTFIEGFLNLNFEEDVVAGVTGELALSASDLTQFNPEALDNLNLNFDNGTFEPDAGQVDTQFCFVFNPSYPVKWNQVGNSLANLQNVSVIQSDYRGSTVSEFAENIYYGETAGMSLLGFSEDEIHVVIDTSMEKKQPAHLKQLPKSPTAVVQLNVARLLEINRGIPPTERFIADASEIMPLLAWVSVKDQTALLTVTLSDKEIPIEVLAKLAPFVVGSLNK